MIVAPKGWTQVEENCVELAATATLDAARVRLSLDGRYAVQVPSRRTWCVEYLDARGGRHRSAPGYGMRHKPSFATLDEALAVVASRKGRGPLVREEKVRYALVDQGRNAVRRFATRVVWDDDVVPGPTFDLRAEAEAVAERRNQTLVHLIVQAARRRCAAVASAT